MTWKDVITLVLASIGTILGILNLVRSIWDDRMRLRVLPRLAWRQGNGGVITAHSTDRLAELARTLGLSEIYDESYLRIMTARPGRKVLSKEQFYARMNALKTSRHGDILVAKGAGWYEFRENVVRGYVRLRAEGNGIILGRDHFANDKLIVSP
jgi:hypothetical protein